MRLTLKMNSYPSYKDHNEPAGNTNAHTFSQLNKLLLIMLCKHWMGCNLFLSNQARPWVRLLLENRRGDFVARNTQLSKAIKQKQWTSWLYLGKARSKFAVRCNPIQVNRIVIILVRSIWGARTYYNSLRSRRTVSLRAFLGVKIPAGSSTLNRLEYIHYVLPGYKDFCGDLSKREQVVIFEVQDGNARRTTEIP